MQLDNKVECYVLSSNTLDYVGGGEDPEDKDNLHHVIDGLE